MTLAIDPSSTLSAEDAKMLKELAESIQENGMDSPGPVDHTPESKFCLFCRRCVSCRCMLLRFS